jgi:hypothetical protein
MRSLGTLIPSFPLFFMTRIFATFYFIFTILNFFIGVSIYPVTVIWNEMGKVLIYNKFFSRSISQFVIILFFRLLLGREIDVTDSQVLRLWDYMFASCLIFPTKSVDLVDPLSVDLVNAHGADINQTSSQSKYSPSNPLLNALGNFMLAMLLHIRSDLIDGDISTALGLLMHFPTVADVTPIVDLADMIRRGVLDPGAHIGFILDGGVSSSAYDDVKPLTAPQQMSVRIREVAKPFRNVGIR